MLAHIRSNAREIQLPTDAAIAARQREALMDDLAKVAGAARGRVAAAWGRQMMADKGWSEAELAALALTLLADERGANLEENPSDEPETWGQPQLVRKPEARRDVRGDRWDGPGRGFQDERQGRGPHDERHARGFERRHDGRRDEGGPGRAYGGHQDERPARPARAQDREGAMSPERAARLALFQSEPANAAFDSVPRTPENFVAEKKAARAPAPERGDRFDSNERAKPPAKAAKAPATDRGADRSDRSDTTERAKPASKAPQAERGDRFDTTERAKPAARAAKAERGDRFDTTERAKPAAKDATVERGDRFDTTERAKPAAKAAKAPVADAPAKAEPAERPARPETAPRAAKAERTTVRGEAPATPPQVLGRGRDFVCCRRPAGRDVGGHLRRIHQ
jgi:hypothetical protein